jgi:hypothetical protein
MAATMASIAAKWRQWRNETRRRRRNIEEINGGIFINEMAGVCRKYQ